MGLIWSERVARRNWDGHDTRGTQYANVIGHADRYGAYINPRGSGHPRGMWIHNNHEAYRTPEDAMEAADRHVTAYLDSLGAGGVELRHSDTPPR